MKKITYYFIAFCFALTVFSSNASTIAPITVVASQTEQADILVNRLTEIKEMDKSGLTSSDKKQLRTEVLSIQEQLKQMDGGIYLSVGAIIVILLILILIF